MAFCHIIRHEMSSLLQCKEHYCWPAAVTASKNCVHPPYKATLLAYTTNTLVCLYMCVCVCVNVYARVDRFGLFGAKKTNLAFFYWLASNFLRIYQVVGFFKKYIEVYIVKTQIYPFLKQSLPFFSYKHLATLHSMH